MENLKPDEAVEVTVPGRKRRKAVRPLPPTIAPTMTGAAAATVYGGAAADPKTDVPLAPAPPSRTPRDVDAYVGESLVITRWIA